MRISARYGLSLCALAIALILALIGYLLTGPASAQDPPAAQARYELSGQILSRVNDDGAVEFCLRSDDGQTICPNARFVNLDRVRRDRWLSSSEIAWSAPAQESRIRYVSDTPSRQAEGASCDPNFARMLAATWKVESSSSLGTAFHIGNGRFVTAHHVIENRPPFVSLIHGERTIGAAVLGYDEDLDLALLEVDTPGLLQDVPAMRLRAPTQDDVAQPVYLIGYPGGEALTISGGGVVVQVWDDNLQTSAAVRSGNSGGPMFDACGDVLGVIWAGSASWSYTYSGASLLRSLRKIDESWPRWPLMPESVPPSLRAGGRMIWHYGPEPPQMVDCSELDAEWWIAVSGIPDEAEVRADLERSGWRQIGVCGALGPDDLENGRTYVAALEAISVERPESEDCAAERTPAVVHQSTQPFGELLLYLAEAIPDCPQGDQYSLQLDLASPQPPGSDLGATLVGVDGSLLGGPWLGRSFLGIGESPESPVTTFWQDWSADPAFTPAALRIAVGFDRWYVPLGAEVAREADAESFSIDVSVRIVARIDSETGTLSACLRSDNQVSCGADQGLTAYTGVAGRWRESAPISWSVSLPAESTPLATHAPVPTLSCEYEDPHDLYAWQFNSLAGTGTAVHVGDRQFLVNGARVPDGAPWGVVSRGATSLPVIRIAHDPRNDQALVELFDTEQEVSLGQSALFGSTGEELIGSNVHLLTYPAGDASRFLLAVLNVSEMTERVLRVEPSGISRHGSPLIDLCSNRLLGISIGGDDLLRAETVSASLSEMRLRAERPVYRNDGPPAHGSASAHSLPLYDGPTQPQFSGRICDVHPSERYHGRYAVYVSNVDNPDVWRVYERDGARPDTCDFGDKIFIVEYRDDQVPEAICIEPRRPLSPVSTVEWELDAPDGVELLLVRDFVRDDCPGLSTLEQTRWFSTHYFKLRNTGPHDFSDFTVRVITDEDKRLVPRRDVYTFADSDVWAWRVRVTDGTAVKVVVTVR